VAAEFSDPDWWPTPPPRPPKKVPLARLVVGTVAPALAVAAVVVLVVVQQSRPRSSPSVTPSIAAFEACLRAHGIADGQQGSDVGRATRACRSALPAGTQAQAFGPAPTPRQASIQAAFEQCVRNAVAGLPRGGGPLGGGPSRRSFEDALSVCRATAQHESTAPTTTAATTTPSAV
jgi:hypothetical protein